MRLVRYTIDDRAAALGCVVEDAVHAVEGDPLDAPVPGERVAALEQVRLLAPCRPSKVVAIAINFPAMDNFVPGMSEPMVFVMPPTCVCGPGDPVVNPFPELPWWGEAELAVVVGRRLRDAGPEEVRDAVLVFTVANDPTVQNVEGRDHHLARSKCSDGFCPLGPWIDTDFDASDALVEAIQNGEVIRRGRTSEQFWQWPRILEWLSSWMTLEPWDVLLTGNPPDTVGMRYVEHGDVYTARVEGLGDLTNPFYLAGRHPDV